MNLPNLLTCSRIVLTVFFVVFLFSPGLLFKILALSMFLLASLTDYWDGRLARQSGKTSVFGEIMDPIADKVLTLSAFFSFAAMGLFSFWLAAIVALRDTLVTALRFSSSPGKQAIPVRQSGKQKTFFQIVFIVTVLLFLIWRESPVAVVGWEAGILNVIQAGMIVVVVLTIWSGLRTILKRK